MAETRPVAVKLPPEMHERVRRIAEARQRSAHFVMREAIAQYVEREEKREALRRDALVAWAAFRETGRHVPHDEADDWLAELEAGRGTEPPACRD